MPQKRVSSSNKENIVFSLFYSTKGNGTYTDNSTVDFSIIEQIISKAEKRKQLQRKKNPSIPSIITLSDIIESYKRVMSKKGVDPSNETHFYSLIVKLSLN